jgi:hypothetical protein
MTGDSLDLTLNTLLYYRLNLKPPLINRQKEITKILLSIVIHFKYLMASFFSYIFFVYLRAFYVFNDILITYIKKNVFKSLVKF